VGGFPAGRGPDAKHAGTTGRTFGARERAGCGGRAAAPALQPDAGVKRGRAIVIRGAVLLALPAGTAAAQCASRPSARCTASAPRAPLLAPTSVSIVEVDLRRRAASPPQLASAWWHPPHNPLETAPVSVPGAGAPLGRVWSVPSAALLPQRGAWPRLDAALAAGFVLGLWVDAAQTRTVARAGWQGFREANPLLGPRPTVGQVNRYTAIAGLTTLGLAAVLPPQARRWWLGAAFALEVTTVAGSARRGIAITLR
jgi:hypothetical protein